MTAEPNDKASVFWGVMASSCTISMYRGEQCKDGVSIRANVPFADQAPAGWQSQLGHLSHSQNLTPEEVRSAMSRLGPITLFPKVFASMGTVEIRGASNTLKVWITTHSHKGLQALSDDEKNECAHYLTSLAQMIFEKIIEPEAPGSAAWR